MMLDKELMLSDAQAVTTATATPSTSYIDLLADGNLGVGEELFVHGRVHTTVEASGGAANVTFALQVDADVNFGSATTILTTAAIAKATLTAGYVFWRQPLPPNPLGEKARYLRALITPDTNDLTAGKFDIGITRNVDLLPATPYPRASYPQA